MKTNIAAEHLLLSCFIRNPQTFFYAASYLADADFSHISTKYLYEIIKSLYLDKRVEQFSKVKIIAAAKSLGFENFMSVTSDYKLVDEILNTRVESVEFPAIFQDVKKCTIIRNYNDKFRDLSVYLKDTTDSPMDIVGNVESSILGETSSIEGDKHAIIKLGSDAKETIETLAKDPGQMGIDIGLPIWQSRCGQIRNGSVTLIVADSKAGKSQFGLWAGLRTGHKHKLPVLLADSELNKQDQIVRLVGMFAGVRYHTLETGLWRLSEEELNREGITDNNEVKLILQEGVKMRDQHYWDQVEALPLYYMSIAGLGIEAVIPRLRQWVMTEVKPDPQSKFPQCLIIYDYIKLAHINELRGGKLAEWQLHGLNVAAVHNFAHEMHLPILTFGQTNKGVDTNFNCVAGAKRIVENVDSISLLKRKTDDELSLDPAGNYLMNVFAARHGRGTPYGHINLQFDGSIGSLNEIGFSSVNFEQARQERREQWKKKRDDVWDDDD